MPLRDHFRFPVSKQVPWESFYGGWPMVLVQQLRKLLSQEYIAAPRVHFGNQVYFATIPFNGEEKNDLGGATALLVPPRPTLAVETAIADEDEYEVKIYDVSKERTLVATIELVSPGNKDRPGKRNLFVAKCIDLIRQGVSVSIVDIVTTRAENFYAELLDALGQTDPSLGHEPPALYVATCRHVARGDKMMLETWAEPLTLGQPLPGLPLWLGPGRFLPFELEPGYEQSFHDLWIS